MSTHNICFRSEIRKISFGCPLLSVAMTETPDITTTAFVPKDIAIKMIIERLFWIFVRISLVR